jgi:hypothetical protein
MAGRLRRAGVDQDGLDLWSAVFSGLVAQQISNDPEGDRWERLVPRATRMLLTELTATTHHA